MLPPSLPVFLVIPAQAGIHPSSLLAESSTAIAVLMFSVAIIAFALFAAWCLCRVGQVDTTCRCGRRRLRGPIVATDAADLDSIRHDLSAQCGCRSEFRISNSELEHHLAHLPISPPHLAPEGRAQP